MPTPQHSIALFCYGTLRCPEIMEKVIGYRPPGTPATLPDYFCGRIRDEVFPGIRPLAGSSVLGELFMLKARDLAALDRYEGSLYQRRQLSLTSEGGETRAYTYVTKPAHYALITPEAWDLTTFIQQSLTVYLENWE